MLQFADFDRRRLTVLALLIVVLVHVVFGIHLAGAQPKVDHKMQRAATSPATTQAATALTGIIVWGRSPWYVMIGPDGDGRYSHGAGAPIASSAEFPPGTFNLAELADRLRSGCNERDANNGRWTPEPQAEPVRYGVGFHMSGSSTAQVMETEDERLIREVFKKAMAAGSPSVELQRLILEQPPFDIERKP